MSAELFAAFRAMAGRGLTQSQVDGINAIILAPEARGWDPRWLAYALATAMHETGGLMQPVREGFKSTDEAARAHVRRMFEAGKISRDYAEPHPATGQSYYGRGIVQLTHHENYVRAGAKLGLPLAEQPDIALEPDVSAAILLRGMREGWFAADRTGQPHNLPRYFDAVRTDPVNARRIVNGVDRAEEIAGYYRRLVEALPPVAAPSEPPADTALQERVAALERQVADLLAFRAGVLTAAQLGAGPL